MTLKAVIFDLDGTLADTEEGHRLAFNETFAEWGLDWDWDPTLYRELLAVGGGRERIRYYVDHYHPEVHETPDESDWIERLHRRKTEHYLRDIANVQLRPGVARLLTALKAEGVRVALATTSSLVNVEKLFGPAPEGVTLDTFEVLGTGECAPHKKPAPDVYTYVLDTLGLPATACLAVEDASIGVQAALAAALPVVVTVNPWTEAPSYPGAVSVVSCLGDAAHPARHVAGAPLAGTEVDVAQLRAWHAAATT